MSITGSWTSQPWSGVGLDPTSPIAANVRALWLFNSPQNVVYNLAGNGSSTLTGTTKPAWSSSPYGRCLTFNGSTAYLPSVVPAKVLDFIPATGVFTIAARVRQAAFSANAGGGVLACDGATATTAVTLWYENRSIATPASPAQYKLAVGVGVSGTFGLSCATGVGSIADNNWHHVAFSASGTAISAYLDGKANTGAASVSGSHSSTMSSLPDIGRFNTNALFLNGDIEHIMVLDRALAADEIASLYADPYQVFLPPWPWPQLWVPSQYPAVFDMGAGLEVPAVAAGLLDLDPWAGVESAIVSAAVYASELGSGAEWATSAVVSAAVAVFSSDLFAGTDGTKASGGPALIDAFTGTAGTSLGAHTPDAGGTWSQHGSYSGQAVLTNANRVRSNFSAVPSLWVYSVAPSGPDYDVTVDVFPAGGSSGQSGPAGRIDTANDTYYYIAYDINLDVFKLRKVVSGTSTVLATGSASGASGPTVTLRLRGTSIQCLVNGSIDCQATDSAISAAGRQGIYLSGTSPSNTVGVHLDNFTAGAAATTAGPEWVTVLYFAGQSGTGTEAIGLGLTATDSGQGSDSATAAASVFAGQAGAGLEWAASATLATPVFAGEVGAGGEAIGLGLMGSDLGTCLQAAPPVPAVLFAGEPASWVESGLLLASLAALDRAAGVEFGYEAIGTSSATIFTGDRGAGFEGVWLAVSAFGRELGGSVESGVAIVVLFAGDVWAAVEGQSESTTAVGTTPWASELAAGREWSSVSASLFYGDAGQGAEQSPLVQIGNVIFGAQAGAGSELASVSVQVFGAEVGRPIEQAPAFAVVFARDSGTAVEWARGVLRAVQYHVYANTGRGDPVSYGVPVATVAAGLAWSGGLDNRGVWSFAVRAFDTSSLLEEWNTDVLTVAIDAAWYDRTGMPASPLGLHLIARSGGRLRAVWISRSPDPSRRPQGFRVYRGTGGVVDYSSPPAGTVAYRGDGDYAFDLAGLTPGTPYTVGVRAFNATGEEGNAITATATSDSSPPAGIDGLSGVATSDGGD